MLDLITWAAHSFTFRLLLSLTRHLSHAWFAFFHLISLLPSVGRRRPVALNQIISLVSHSDFNNIFLRAARTFGSFPLFPSDSVAFRRCAFLDSLISLMFFLLNAIHIFISHSYPKGKERGRGESQAEASFKRFNVRFFNLWKQNSNIWFGTLIKW